MDSKHELLLRCVSVTYNTHLAACQLATSGHVVIVIILQDKVKEDLMVGAEISQSSVLRQKRGDTVEARQQRLKQQWVQSLRLITQTNGNQLEELKQHGA